MLLFFLFSGAGRDDNTSCRRLPSLLARGFPNPQAVANPSSSNWQRTADLEIGDAAGLEPAVR
jgi:hypothetical protein